MQSKVFDRWSRGHSFTIKTTRVQLSFQQEEVLSEIFSYANPKEGIPPDDREQAMATHSYLTACSQLFEFGLLKSKWSQISNVEESETLQSILTGYQFFKSWMDHMREDCE
jgi:hypothetical protein